MKKYRLEAEVTISIHAEIYANSKEEALEMADELSMPTIHEDHRYNNEDEPDETWGTSGELDGEAVNIQVTELNDIDMGEDDE